jgi:hypothetical protein
MGKGKRYANGSRTLSDDPYCEEEKNPIAKND